MCVGVGCASIIALCMNLQQKSYACDYVCLFDYTFQSVSCFWYKITQILLFKSVLSLGFKWLHYVM